jgi:hypothetical protein
MTGGMAVKERRSEERQGGREGGFLTPIFFGVIFVRLKHESVGRVSKRKEAV